MSDTQTARPRRPFLELLAENKRSTLRRARVLAARSFGNGSIPRRACLAGAYDTGSIIRGQNDANA